MKNLVKTSNFPFVVEHITSQKISCAVSDVTLGPLVIVERCEIMLRDFIERFLMTSCGREDLMFDLEHRHEIPETIVNLVCDQIHLAREMLNEIQDYNEFSGKGAINND